MRPATAAIIGLLATAAPVKAIGVDEVGVATTPVPAGTSG